jgi:hypothetical protein
MLDQPVGVLRREGLHKVTAAHFQDPIDEVLEFTGAAKARCPLKMTRSKQESTATIK